MKAPRYRIYGWSWLGVVNFLFIQWFFVRLELSGEKPLVPGKTEMKLGLLIGVWPLTGWWNDYVYVREPFLP